MKSALETLSPTRVKLTVEVPFEELKPSLDAAIKHIGEHIQVPGFRRGKVPARIIEQRVGRAAVLEEAVNNALKHARARHIWVRLRRDGRNLVTVVQDDGVGFDMQGVLRSYEKRGSFGLLNIDERARLVGGSAEMESAPGKGTKVTIVVPIEA